MTPSDEAPDQSSTSGPTREQFVHVARSRGLPLGDPAVELEVTEDADGNPAYTARRAPAGGPWSTRLIGACFVLMAGCGVGFTWVYATGGQTQLEGAFLGIGFLSLSVGLVSWASRLMPETVTLGARHDLDGDPAAEAMVDRALDRTGEVSGRRHLLGLLALGLGGIGTALIVPLRSLGPSPGTALEHTSWAKGLRLVTRDGVPVRSDEVPPSAMVTVFPEGHVGEGDAVVVLVRVPADLLSESTVKGGTVDGRVAYSKVCSHAGCPVGQFRVDDRRPDPSYELLCPCHQSQFDVCDGARPTGGPAPRPLSQLPLSVDGDGFLIATGDFPEPVGPGFWSRP